MRNLKRALSLALASVMVMGLAVVGSNASYVDVTSKQNQEAIEVLQKVGIMVGDENGKFNPEAKVTRNEMAVIMANLMDYRVSTYKGTSPFTDVPAWAEPYVAACYTNGIISGYSAKTYGGNDVVATSQAALMLMKALGYFQFQSDFEDDWQLATIKQGGKIELFDGVDSGVKAAMTRNDVAQLVLNALKAGMVEASDDTIKVNTGDVKVEAGKVNYNYVTSSKSYASAIDNREATSSTSSTKGSIVELGEKLYNGDLKLKDGQDDFKAPANRWTYKNEEIGTYADSADYTFSGIVKSNAFYDAVSKNVVDNYSWSVYTDGVAGDKAALQKAVKNNNKEDLDVTVRGSNTYVYLNDDKDPHTATVVVKNTYIGEVTKVKDGTITIDDMDEGALDFDTTGYSEGDMVLYTKTGDDVQEVLGKAELKEGTVETVRNDNRIVVDGTTYRYSKMFNDVNDGMLDTASVDQKVSFYLDGQGNIIAFEDTAANQDYAFVYSMGNGNDQYGGDDTIGAKLVMADGTVKSVIIDNDDIKTAKKAYPSASGDLDAAKKYFGWSIVSYSENSNGKYSITKQATTDLTAYSTFTSDDGKTLEDIVKNGSARILDKDGKTATYADKNTVFLINETTDDGDDFNTYVGYNNIPNVNAIKGTAGLMGDPTGKSSSKDDNATTGLVYYAKNGVAKFVVITDAEVSGSTNDVIFVVGEDQTSIKKNKTGSTEYYVYDAVVNGEVTSIKVKASSEAQKALAKVENNDVVVNGKTYTNKNIAIFFGMTKDSNGYVTKLTTATPKDVAAQLTQTTRNSTKILATGTQSNSDVIGGIEWTGTKRESNGGNVSFGYTVDGKGKVSYTNSLAANSKALVVYYDGEDLSVVSKVNTDNDDQATVITDDGDIIAVLVREFDGTKLTHG